MSLQLRARKRNINNWVLTVASVFAFVVAPFYGVVENQVASAASIVAINSSNAGANGWGSSFGNTEGTIADTKNGGHVIFVSDADAPLNKSALQLTTTGSTAKAQYMTTTTHETPLASLHSLSYNIKKNAGGDASIQLRVCLYGVEDEVTLVCKDDGNSATDYKQNATVFVYEPNLNGYTTKDGTWLFVDAIAGNFWSSRTVAGTYLVNPPAHSTAMYSLDKIKHDFHNAVVIAYGVSIGAANDNYNVEVDGFNFNGTTYDFGTVTPPASAPQTSQVVRPIGLSTTNTNAWYYYNDDTENATTAPVGGEYEIKADPSDSNKGALYFNSTDKMDIMTNQYAGIKLADIAAIGYSSYNVAGTSTGPTYIQFNVSFDGKDTWQNRLTYVPPVSTGAWQQNEGIQSGNGMWSWSGGTTWRDGVQAEMRSWSDIINSFPNAEIRVNDTVAHGVGQGQLLVRSEAGAANYIDNVFLATKDQNVHYNFEMADKKAPVVNPITVTTADGTTENASGTNLSGNVTFHINQTETNPNRMYVEYDKVDGKTVTKYANTGWVYNKNDADLTVNTKDWGDGTYQIKVSTDDQAWNHGGSSTTFTVDNTAPQITSVEVSPIRVNGHIVHDDVTVTVKLSEATSLSAYGNWVHFTNAGDSSTYNYALVPTGNQNEYQATVKTNDFAAGKTYDEVRVYIRTQDILGNKGAVYYKTSDGTTSTNYDANGQLYYLTIDNQAPNVTFLTPNNNIQNDLEVGIRVTDDHLNKVSLTVTTPDGKSFSTLPIQDADGDGVISLSAYDLCTNAHYGDSCDFGDLIDGVYKVRAAAYDLAGNRNITTGINIVVDTSAPDGTFDVPANYVHKTVNIKVDLSAVGAAGLGQQQVVLRDSNGVAVGNWQYNVETGATRIITGDGTFGYTGNDRNGTLAILFDTTGLNGTYNLRLFTKDQLGNGRSDIYGQLNIDNNAPAVPTITSNKDLDVNGHETFTISGIETGASLAVELNGTPADNADLSSDNDGTYTLTVDMTKYVNTSLTITATQTDQSNNISDRAGLTVNGPEIQKENNAKTTSTGSLTITWTTDEDATSRVVYDTVPHDIIDKNDPNFGYASSTPTIDTDPMVTQHTVILNGLAQNTIYYFRVVSHGSPVTVSDQYSFSSVKPAKPGATTTSSVNNGTNTPAPVVTNITATPTSQTAVLGANDNNADGATDGSATDRAVKGAEKTVAAVSNGIAWYYWAIIVLAALALLWWIIAAIRRHKAEA